MNSINLQIVRNSQRTPLLLEYQAAKQCLVKCNWGEGLRDFAHHDLFSCIADLRSALEQSNIKILCGAAHRKAWPSSLSRNMGYGMEVLILEIGQPSDRAPKMSIFDAIEESDWSTVEEQRSHFQAWYAALTKS